MFGNKHTYCKVKFDDEKTYWYRTNDYGFRAGMKVIVPVTNFNILHDQLNLSDGKQSHREKQTPDDNN